MSDRKVEEVDPKLAHSINYNLSTSDIKDDIEALIDTLKNGKVLSRCEAGFLIWYHALCTPEKRLEIVESNGASALLLVIVDQKSTPAEQSVALGILRTLSEDEKIVEMLGSAKASGSGMFAIHCTTSCIFRGTETQAVAAASVLRNIAQNPVARKSLLRECPNWVQLLRALKLHANETFKAHVLSFIALCASDRPDIVEDLEKIDAVQYALEHLQSSPSDEVVTYALALINQLLSNPAVAENLVRRQAIPLIMEVFGPPAPKPALLQIPGEASMLDVEKSALSLSAVPSTLTVNPSTTNVDIASSPSGKGGRKSLVEKRTGPQLASGYEHSIQAHTEAAAILWHMALIEDGRIAVTKNSGSWRLCSAIMHALESRDDEGGKGKKGGGKGKKSKGLVLTPTQEAAVNQITGCLRHLSLVDTNKIRIARFEGIVKVLIALYDSAAKASVRWNARGILSNLSTMRSNEALLREAECPEEFGGLANLEIDAEMARELTSMPH